MKSKKHPNRRDIGNRQGKLIHTHSGRSMELSDEWARMAFLEDNLASEIGNREDTISAIEECQDRICCLQKFIADTHEEIIKIAKVRV